MFDFTRLESGELGETATYSSRAWGWYRAHAGIPLLGLLQIDCVDHHGNTHSHQYHVEELPPLPGLLGREFKLTRKQMVYQVSIGGLSRCSCMAGQCRGKEIEPCKHLAALRAMESRGLLGGMETIDNERSGSAFEDRPGEPTVAELAQAN